LALPTPVGRKPARNSSRSDAGGPRREKLFYLYSLSGAGFEPRSANR
jgi:hypothetical protein